VFGLAAAGLVVVFGLFWWSSHVSKEYTTNEIKTQKVNSDKYSK
jgi:hypothetical protein